MTSHPSVELLEAYVLDTLDPLPARALEQHVRCCDRCAEALAAESRREVALGELVPRVATARRQDRAPMSAIEPANRWLSPFLLAATSAVALVITAANPRAIHTSDGPPVWFAQNACEGPALVPETPLLCLNAGGGETAMCRRPMSVELDPGRDREGDVQLFSCSGCSCPAEPLR
jgi:anti-sigma factor RsiW